MDKRQLPLFASRLVELGFKIWATEGTASVLRRYGIESKVVDKLSTRLDGDGNAQTHVVHAPGSVGKNVVELIEDGTIDMVLNTPNSRGSRADGGCQEERLSGDEHPGACPATVRHREA